MYKRILLTFLMLLVGLSVSAYAQSGQIAGTVFDLYGASLPDTKITFKSEGGKIFQVFSHDDGKYKSELPAGLYEVTFERRPFTTFRISDYWLYEKGEMRLDVSMRCVGCQIVSDNLIWTPTELIQTDDELIRRAFYLKLSGGIRAEGK